MKKKVNFVIDEKQLITELELEIGETYNCDIGYGLKRAIEIVKHRPLVGEWIQCSERLPEEDKNNDYYDAVIATLDDGRVSGGCYRNRDEEWWVDAEDGEKHSINATGHVIAWMPLPEAYKEEVN